MQRLEVSGAVRPIYGSLGFKRLRTKLYLTDLKSHFERRSKHSASFIKTDKLMLYREIIAVCNEIHTKHMNTLCGQNTEFLDVKAGGT